jgi:aflatoxin B1 aldehyde reductase
VLYIHAPDNVAPIAEQVKGYDELYRRGVFKQLGLSNYSPAEVQEFYDAAKANGCVLPTVYEGSYSAVGRIPEADLLPLLRKLGIAYNAYSPIAGGMLAKSKEEVLSGAGRWDPNTFFGKLYNSIFNKPSYLNALDLWGEIARDAGVARAELAYRWVTYHSVVKAEHGDGIIIGARDGAQLKDTIKILKAGPLPASIVDRVDALWDLVKDDAVLDNWHGYLKDLFSQPKP